MSIPTDLIDKFGETLDILQQEGVLGLKNGSAELFFDDIGLLQEIVLKRRKRKEAGKELIVIHKIKTNASLDYDGDGTLQQIVYTTKWRRPRTDTKGESVK